MSRFNPIDFQLTSLTSQLNKDTDRADYDAAYEAGAREKPLADSQVVMNEEALVQKALYHLMVRDSGKWHKELIHDFDGALNALETELMRQAHQYDAKRRY